jgi:hypothetical protein
MSCESVFGERAGLCELQVLDFWQVQLKGRRPSLQLLT